ncbi:hypothetical protein BRAS3843_770030 [Bradyrhizobium sp. STM 3843]|uniref:hypothetical protein n=1 Tax=Bradyrhizobium sp. STM 3843 TaxID=551947 RepID=UPI0002404A29|nr:hypothetical protein [Bradyrhizobium sp. STM 3843]CCE11732.1 hypothetical protein BRAS3843_770030 [Bradyrhizobium sp. STM 3843]
MPDQDVIAAARAAWKRIRTRPLFSDWMAIGKALVVGKAQCLHQARVNKPYGPVYMRAMRTWLDSAGLGDVETQERRGAIFLAEHESEVTAWRDSLSPAEQRNANHPSTIVRHYQRGTRPRARGPRPAAAPDDHHRLGEIDDEGHFVWPDEAKRRVVLALRNTQGQPLAVQADAALRAAIRSLADYRSLRPVTSRPATPAVIELRA